MDIANEDGSCGGFGVGTLCPVECDIETTKRSSRCLSLAHCCHEEGVDILEWLRVHEWSGNCYVELRIAKDWRLEEIL